MTSDGETAAAVGPTTASEPVDPDREAMARVAAGERQAFDTIVMRHQERLVGLCERMLGEREAALDAAQETFLKAYRNASRYRPSAKVYTWLYRIAVNHCLNQLRRRKIVRFFSLTPREDSAGSEVGGLIEPQDKAPGPWETLAARRRWRETCRRIDTLPVNQRAVLILAKLEGLSYRQIAETLNISIGAVESRLFRAMRRLASADREGSRP